VRRIALFLVLLTILTPVFAQVNQSKGFDLGIVLGTDLLPDPKDATIPPAMDSWTKVGFRPEVAFGKLAVGLDLTFRFKFASGSTTSFEIYEPDWIPQPGKTTILDVYLPKLLYVRYGFQGIDPFYFKAGSVSDFNLGNGLIMDNYSNMLFLPQRRIFGMQVGIDGNLFGFPYVGIEALSGNLAKFDVIGGRVYIRPLAFLGKSLFGRLQVGAIGVYDKDPLIYADDTAYGTSFGTSSPTYVIGADVTLPILQNPLFSLTTFAEGAMEVNKAMGAMTGVRGRLLGFISYGLQLRYLQDNFIPAYFDTNYDLYRAERFAFIRDNPAGTAYTPSWLASAGVDIFKSLINVRATVDAPFKALPSPATSNPADYPHLLGRLTLNKGLIPNFSVAARYEKYFLGKKSGNIFSDLIDPTDASIGMTVSYWAGAAVVSLDYIYSWNPTKNDFDVSSGLSIGFQL